MLVDTVEKLSQTPTGHPPEGVIQASENNKPLSSEHQTHKVSELLYLTDDEWEKVKQLERALNSLSEFDSDLQAVITDHMDLALKSVKSAIENLVLFSEDLIKLSEQATQTQLDRDSVPSTPESTVQDWLDQVEERLNLAYSTVTKKRNPLQSLLPKRSTNKRRVFISREPKPFDQPFRDFFSDVPVPGLPNLSASQKSSSIEILQARLTAWLGQVDSLSEMKSAAKVRFRSLFDKYEIDQLEYEAFARSLDINFPDALYFSPYINQLKREISDLKDEQEYAQQSLVQEVESAIQQVHKIIASLREPETSELPISIWWTKEFLILVLVIRKKLLDASELDVINDQIRNKLESLANSFKQQIFDYIYDAEINHNEMLEVGKSPDVMYHSASSLNDVVKILLDGKIKSLGKLREKNGQWARNTDNLGGGKREDQELHQIYFNGLGEEESFPVCSTRDNYSPIIVPSNIFDGDEEGQQALQLEISRERERRRAFVPLLQQMGLTTFPDGSRFPNDQIITDDDELGLPDDVRSFLIATGFFFRKRDLLKVRKFFQDDSYGAGVFDGNYVSNDREIFNENQTDKNFLEIDWRQEGCFGTDQLGWCVIAQALRKELRRRGFKDEEIEQVVADIKANTVIFESQEWGGSFNVTRMGTFLDQEPDVQLESGEVIPAYEIKYQEMLSGIRDLSQAQQMHRNKIVGKAQAITKQYETGLLNLQRVRDKVKAFLAQTHGESPEYKSDIVPDLSWGDLPNASGHKPKASVYKLLSQE